MVYHWFSKYFCTGSIPFYNDPREFDISNLEFFGKNSEQSIAILCILFINPEHPHCGCTEKTYLCWAFTIIFIILNNSSIQGEKLANLKRKKEKEKTLLSLTLFSCLPLSAGNTTYRRSSPHSRVGNVGIFFWFFLEDLWWNSSAWNDRHIWSTDLAVTFSQLEGNGNEQKSSSEVLPFHVHILAHHYLTIF